MLHEFTADLQHQLWRKASQFEGAADLQHGADFSQIKRELDKCERKQDMDNWGLTLTVVSGGQWT
eukprot:7937382-Pyramimonas_sp.AAC.1